MNGQRISTWPRVVGPVMLGSAGGLVVLVVGDGSQTAFGLAVVVTIALTALACGVGSRGRR